MGSYVTASTIKELPEDLVLNLCDMSYDLVFAKLPKRAQRETAQE